MTGRTTGIASTGRTSAKSRSRRTGLVAVGAAALLTLAACGSGGSNGGTSASAAGSGKAAARHVAHPGKIATGSTNLGKVLVDPHGKTLYAFAADAPHHSACTGSCLAYWPPVPGADAAALAGSGVTAKLGVLKRSDGSRQLTANGFPMYTYAGDTAVGQANGQGKNLSGGLWWVVAPTGAWVKGGGAATSGTSSGTRGGY
jgi:predicted lipoprotein with Yx(FWY)xxD motif